MFNYFIEHWANLAKNRPFIQLNNFCSLLKLKGVAKTCQGLASAPPRHTLNEALQSVFFTYYIRYNSMTV